MRGLFLLVLLVLTSGVCTPAKAQSFSPDCLQSVNPFAGVFDPGSNGFERFLRKCYLPAPRPQTESDKDFLPQVSSPYLQRGQRGYGPSVPIEVRLRIFIPAPLVSLVNILSVNDVFNLGCMATQVIDADTCLFRGDNRGFAYSEGTQRLFANITLLPGGGWEKYLYYCRTHEYRPSQGYNRPGAPWWWFEPYPNAREFENERLRVDPANEGIDVVNYDTGYQSRIHIRIRGANPLVRWGPPIDAEVIVDVLYRPGYTMYAQVTGVHDYFPAYELYVNGVLMQGEGLPYNPANTFLASPYSLFGSVLPRQTISVPGTEIPDRFTKVLPKVTAVCR